MIIRDAQVAMAARDRQQVRVEHTESLRMRGGGRTSAPTADRLALSGTEPAREAGTVSDPLVTDPKLRLLIALIEEMTGYKIRTVNLQDCRMSADEQAASTQQTNIQPAAGWGLTYDARTTYDESQSLSFSANGVAVTADGRQFNFQLDLQAMRAFHLEEELHLRAGDAAATDPLAINLQGLVSQLTEETYDFDLNADGRAEQIAFLQPGSGFLAHLRNGLRKVENGSQLFGPQTGNGLAELAAHDADGNGWIDAGDPIYRELAIWTKDADGDHLTDLPDAGVGAIYRGSVRAKFDLKSAETNALQGKTNRVGVYLREDGSAGSVQQIDLVA